MSDSEHLKGLAPLPWKSHKIRYKTRPRPYAYRLADAEDLTVLLIPGKAGTGTGDRAKEIAEYVLRAASSHEELLAAASWVSRCMAIYDANASEEECDAVDGQLDDALRALRVAIENAKGGKS